MSKRVANKKPLNQKLRGVLRSRTLLLFVVFSSLTALAVIGTVQALTIAHVKQASKQVATKTSKPAKKDQSQATAKTPAPTPSPSKAPDPATPQPAASQAPAAQATAVEVQHASTPVKAQTAPVPAPAPVGDIAPESACPGQSTTASYQSTLVCMTSYARRAHGLGGVSGSGAIAASATKKALDLISCGFSHTACGRAFDYWLAPSGYSCGTVFENIAAGQPTPGSVFVSWMNSSGHRANILSSSAKSVGFGLQASASSQYGIYWVMQGGAC